MTGDAQSFGSSTWPSPRTPGRAARVRDGAGALLLTFGLTLVAVTLLSARNLTALLSAPDLIWAAMCGVQSGPNLLVPIALVVGGLAALIGAGLLVLPRVQPPVRAVLVVGTALALGAIVTNTVSRPVDMMDTFVLPNDAIFLPDPPRDPGNFILRDQDDRLAFLSDFKGKPTLMFFGYTHCPDMCPLALSEFIRIKRELGEQGDDVNFVMISVDGERDTPDVMKRYVKAFDPEFIGLTGPSSVARYVLRTFGGRAESQKPEGTSASYLVAHTTMRYLLDAKGMWRAAYPNGTPIERIAADTAALIPAK